MNRYRVCVLTLLTILVIQTFVPSLITSTVNAATNSVGCITLGVGLKPKGKQCSDFKLSVNLAPANAVSGTKSTVARSDHNHLGEIWNDTAGLGLQINSTAQDATPLVVNSQSGDAIEGYGAVGVLGSGTLAGVYGGGGTGFAMEAGGDTKQARRANGWVKAMVMVDGTNGHILHCYNSQGAAPWSDTADHCGFTVSASQGDYIVDFGFQVNDRFISVNVMNDSDTAIIPMIAYYVPAINATPGLVRVKTFDLSNTLQNSNFVAFVY